jgi:site-specific recombinase XerD/ribosomal protein L40E
MMKDPHNYKARLESTLRRIRESKVISKKNKEAMLRFKDYCLLEISVGRTVRYLECLMKLNQWMDVDFEDVTLEDVKAVVAKINAKEYSEWTKQLYKVTLKKFYRWLKGGKKYPEEVEWIRTTVKRNKKKLPEDLLTEEEIEKLIEAAEHPRDKALIAVLYESGCRIGELLKIKLKHLVFDSYGAKLLVNGKTGARRVRIVSSVPYLTKWINEHPLKEDPEAPLWIDRRRNEQIAYPGVQRVLRILKKRSGIKKNINPHLFRHSRATYLANHLTEAQMCEFFGWVQGSDMPSVYVHLSGRDVDNAILRTYGIKNENEKEESKLKPKKCKRCDEVNPSTNKFCRKCGMTLDEKIIVEITEREMERKRADEILDQLIKDEEFRRILLNKIRQLRLNE